MRGNETVNKHLPRRPAGAMTGLMTGLCLVLVTGCTTGGGTSAARVTGRTVVVATRSAPPRPTARDVLLAQQFDLGMAAASPVDCREDLDRVTKGRPSGHPLVWTSSGTSYSGTAADEVRVGLGEDSVLCLYGFPGNKPVVVTVTAGGQTYTTPVKPVASLEAVQADGDLFNGQPMEVEDRGGGVLQSGYWPFFPPAPARGAIARSGRLTLTARSGDARATNGVPLRVDEGAATAEDWERSRKVVVYGFPSGARVPVGLYRLVADQEGGERAVLVRRVGEVVMPGYRVGEFTVPQDVFRVVGAAPGQGGDAHCLSVAQLGECVTQPAEPD
ncbi:hypothetical protein ACIGQE_17735 [Streptomyces sp. NPDC053429]|uniref:hypothetical protein n=1 Tax=Streptomyces sp. NPDC053429 TaxID=3365702 RepID=UPI0037D25130